MGCGVTRMIWRERAGRVFLLVVALSLWSISISRSQTVFPVPQLAHLPQQGLDPRNNPFDRLIGIYGFSCLQKPPLDKRQCSIEAKLEEFLDGLSIRVANLNEFHDGLTALGSVCQHEDGGLWCVYSREVKTYACLAGSPVPVNILHDHFEIRIFSYDAGGLRHLVEFKRDSAAEQGPFGRGCN